LTKPFADHVTIKRFVARLRQNSGQAQNQSPFGEHQSAVILDAVRIPGNRVEWIDAQLNGRDSSIF
jgi:hypothetical protein